jgi:hypothetical protein
MAECVATLWVADAVDDAVSSNPGLVEDFYLRLRSWWDMRPECLNPSINASPENLVAA